MSDLKPLNKPNFFILGAAKSGTTSLYHYLNQHPEVFLSPVKEPTFFCEDFQQVKNPIQYFELFDGATDEKIIGEASHGYLTDPKVPRVLKSLFPDAKFVIILRNPAERAFSLYQHMRRQRFESISTFEKALKEEEARVKSEDFKNNNPQYFHNYLYFQSGFYGQQIQRYFELFDSKNFHITTLDKLKSDFENTMHRIYTFLNIATDVTVTPEIHNKGYKTGLSAIEKMLHLKVVKNNPVIKNTLSKINHSELDKLEPAVKQRLMKGYEKDQELLFGLTDIRFD